MRDIAVKGSDGLMISFYLWCIGISGFVLATIFLSARRGHAVRATDLDVYTDQMSALKKDQQRGLVNPSEFDALRAEIGRRMLTAKAGADRAQTGGGGFAWLPFCVGVLAVGASATMYAWLGRPAVPDQPIAARHEMAAQALADLPTQADLEAAQLVPPAQSTDPEYVQLVQDLRAALADRPQDLQGYVLLTQAETRLGNLAAAHKAQATVVALKSENVTAADLMLLTELRIAAAGTAISKEAALSLQETLRQDPNMGLARFRLGQLRQQTGRPDLAFSLWRKLLEDGPQDAPYLPAIRRSIGDLAYFAGQQNYQPPTRPGPSAEDVANAQDMSISERAEMIQGMVQGLAARLADEGGPASDWARLIAAYGVLGQLDQAKAIFSEAQTVFKNHPADLQQIISAAQSAGIMQ